MSGDAIYPPPPNPVDSFGMDRVMNPVGWFVSFPIYTSGENAWVPTGRWGTFWPEGTEPIFPFRAFTGENPPMIGGPLTVWEDDDGEHGE